MSDEAWRAMKRDHARLIRAAGAERFVLDRPCLDDDALPSSEVERVRAALEWVGGQGGSGNLERSAEWISCLMAARGAADRERR